VKYFFARKFQGKILRIADGGTNNTEKIEPHVPSTGNFEDIIRYHLWDLTLQDNMSYPSAAVPAGIEFFLNSLLIPSIFI
jgi:hypothetical protein